MIAGPLDRRLTLRRAAVTTNSLNEPIQNWSDLATVWASKADVSDGERVRAQAIGSSITTRFQVRHSSITATLTPEDRVVCEGREYEITGIKEIGRRVGVEITATARTDQTDL
jgi:SPP1 family predicted phage head-tail adaptor